MQEEKKQQNMQKKSKKRMLIVLVALAIFVLCGFVSNRSQYLQALEIGENYVDVFKTNISYKYAIMLINFLVWFIAIYITNLFIRKGLKKFFNEEKKEMPKLPNKSIAFILGGIAAIFTSDIFINKTILFMNSTWFGGNPDPIFGKDIGYYMFQKPFIEMILAYAIAILVGLAIYTIIYYIASFNIYFDGIDIKMLKESTFFKQIIAFTILISICLSGLTLIRTQNILFEEFIELDDPEKTTLYGAGFTDVTVKLWGYRIFAIVIFIAIVAATNFFRKQKYKKAVLSILGIPIYLVALFIAMTTFEWIFVNSNKLDKEKVYIGYNIENTRKAYDIDIDEVELENGGTISEEYAKKYQNVVENIPIVNKEMTLTVLNEYQTSVGFYKYPTSKLQCYDINGKNKFVYVSPREIVIDGISRTYDNKTYDYTHGYGSIITSSNLVDERGNIEYIQSDFIGKDQKINLTEPRIYFGLQTNSTIVVGTKEKKEFDYPITTSTNEENVYNGKAGLNLNFLDRLILGITTNNVNLVFENEGKIILNRNIIERAKKVMPYLIYDENPYLVINNEGKQYWVLDAYTISNNYPYSQKTNIEANGEKTKINYIRNSVKVLIDSYNGTVEFYITDRTDPVIMAYYRLYPSLFMDIEQGLPKDIASHMTYPELLYSIQAEVYQRYHRVQTEVLYRNDDVWEIARFNANNATLTSGTKMEPYYTSVKTLNNDEQLGLVIPYTSLGKQNIISYLVGTYNVNTGSCLTLYKFSSGSNILGPAQLNQQIEQDETISAQITQLNKTGTKLLKSMLIVPIEDTLLYVEPIYQVKLNEEKVPTLAKVIVASGNKVAMGNTLEDALENLLSREAVNIEIEANDNQDDLINAIIKANKNLLESSSNSNWEMMGKDIKKLQELILKLEELEKEEEKLQDKTTYDIYENLNIIENSMKNDTIY